MDRRVKPGGDTALGIEFRPFLAASAFPSEFTLEIATIFSCPSDPVSRACLAQSKASSIAMPDDEARCGRRQCVPRWSAERRPGSSQGPARPGTPTSLRRLGSRKLGVWLGLANPAEEVSQTSWAPPGAPSLSFWREKENRETGAAGRPKKQNPGTAERWLKCFFQTTGCPINARDFCGERVMLAGQ